MNEKNTKTNCRPDLYGFILKETYFGFAPRSLIVYQFMSISSLVIDCFFICGYTFTLFNTIKKQKRTERNTTLDNVFLLLSIAEFCVSSMWILHFFLFKGILTEDFFKEHCNECQAFGSVWFFFYIFEWLFLSCLVYQFKTIIFNPFSILASTFIKKILLVLLISFLSAAICNFGKLGGLSVRQKL